MLLYKIVCDSSEQLPKPFWKKPPTRRFVVEADATSSPPAMVEVAAVSVAKKVGNESMPALKVSDAESTTPPAVSKRMRPALYAAKVSDRVRKVLSPRPRVVVPVKAYPPAPSPTKNWFKPGVELVPVPPRVTARTPVVSESDTPRVLVLEIGRAHV